MTIEESLLMRTQGSWFFYCVYDGHGGSRVAYACCEQLHKLLAIKMDIQNRNISEMNRGNLMIHSYFKIYYEVKKLTLLI